MGLLFQNMPTDKRHIKVGDQIVVHTRGSKDLDKAPPLAFSGRFLGHDPTVFDKGSIEVAYHSVMPPYAEKVVSIPYLNVSKIMSPSGEVLIELFP